MDAWLSSLRISILMHGKRWFLLSFVLASLSMVAGPFRPRWAIVHVRSLQQPYPLLSGLSAKNVQQLPDLVGITRFSWKCNQRLHSVCMISGTQVFAGLTLCGQPPGLH